MTTMFVTNVCSEEESLPLPTYNFEQPPKAKPRRLEQQTDGAEKPVDDQGLPLPAWNFTRECERGGD